jgi:hypothetical protein
MKRSLFAILLLCALHAMATAQAVPQEIDRVDNKREISYAMVGEDARSTFYYFSTVCRDLII